MRCSSSSHRLAAADRAHAQVQVELRRAAQAPRARADRAACRRRARARARRSTPSSPRDRSCECTARIARVMSLASMTAEMLRSEAPCAIARTLMPALPKRAEEPARAAGHAGHVVADDGDDGATLRHPDALHLPFVELDGECALDDGTHVVRCFLAHGEADRMLGAALRDQHHGHAGIAQRTEQAIGRARYADHSGALEIHERDLVDAADAFDGRRTRAGRRRDLRAGMRRVERVANPDRNAAPDGRRHRLRMDHLRAEVRELHRFAVRHLVDDPGLRHLARIAAHHAVDVGPDVNLVGIEQRTEDRRGVVAAVASERRR